MRRSQNSLRIDNRPATEGEAKFNVGYPGPRTPLGRDAIYNSIRVFARKSFWNSIFGFSGLKFQNLYFFQFHEITEKFG